MVSSRNILGRQKTLQRVCPEKESSAAADQSGRAEYVFGTNQRLICGETHSAL